MNNKPKSSVIIQEQNEEEEYSSEPVNYAILEDVNIPKVLVHTHPPQETIQEQIIPPFLEILTIEKPVVHLEYNILNELKKIVLKSLYYKLLKIYPSIVR